jgi:hypothetical protein
VIVVIVAGVVVMVGSLSGGVGVGLLPVLASERTNAAMRSPPPIFPSRTSRQSATTAKIPRVKYASSSCSSMRLWMAGPCWMASSAWRPMSTATPAPTVPTSRSANPMRRSPSFLRTSAASSKSTAVVSSATGKETTRAWTRGQS